jgi:hypothetical protein
MEGIGSEDIVLAYAFGVGCSRQAAEDAVGEDAAGIAAALEEGVRAQGEGQAELEGQGLFVAMGGIGVDPMTGEPAQPGARILYFPRAAIGRATRIAEQGERPFPYFGHGSAYSRKCLELAIGFAREPSRLEKGAFEASIPEPLGIVFAWGPRGVHFGSDDSYEVGVKMAASAARNESVDLGAMSMEDFESFAPTAEDWATYEGLLEDWLRRVHEVLPITFVYKPTSDEQGAFSAWHEESVAKWPALGQELDEALPADIADWARRMG